MTPLFKKLNLKGQKKLCILNPPASFEAELKELGKEVELYRNLESLDTCFFILAFVQTENEIKSLAADLSKKLEGDGVLWLAYPKGSSKKYKAEINRDKGWQPLGDQGFEGVRQVAIDDDWSALRFRRVEHVKSLNRSFAMSEAGKARTKREE